MKLTKEEIENIISIMKEYKNLNAKLDLHSQRLDEIENERSSIKDEILDIDKRIEKLRSTELEFTSMLINKYGKFNLNIETFDIEKS